MGYVTVKRGLIILAGSVISRSLGNPPLKEGFAFIKLHVGRLSLPAC